MRIFLLVAMGWIMMSTAVYGAGASDMESTGASAAWTSAEAAVQEARQLLSEGKLAEAEKVAGASSSRSAAEMGQILQRMRREYGLDEAGLLMKVRKSIPDATAEDLRRWRDGGGLQWRTIDGQVGYFRAEPANLYRFCEEARRRRDERAKPGEPEFVTEKHLAEVIAAAQSSGKTEIKPIRHRVRYSVTVPGDHRLMKVGAVVRCWLPFPREHERQRDVKLISAGPGKAVVAPVNTAHRSVYLEQPVNETGKPIVFAAIFEYTSAAYYPALDDAKAKGLGAGYEAWLGERQPHIAFTPELRQTVAKIVGGETNPLAKARRIFEFVATEIRYCSEEEYCLIPSFSQKALWTRRGDCGIQSMLFITMCRCAGIPARWQSGWETRPGLVNMHDWAEFYVEPWGWLTADVSYGLRKSDDPKVRWFYFGHQDSYRLIVNLDYGRELHPAKQSPRSEPADFQRGEVEIDGRNLYFNEWDFDIDVEWTPVGRT